METKTKDALLEAIKQQVDCGIGMTTRGVLMMRVHRVDGIISAAFELARRDCLTREDYTEIEQAGNRATETLNAAAN